MVVAALLVSATGTIADPAGNDDVGPSFFQSGWGQVDKLRDPDPEPYDNFGSSVAIDGDVMVVGHQLERNESALGEEHGALTVFERDASGEWEPQETFYGEDHVGKFGQVLALDGERFATTAPTVQGDPNFSTCEIYVYERRAGTWQSTVTIEPNIDNDCAMGGSDIVGAHASRALALDGDLLVVGVPELGHRWDPQPGQVLVYEHGQSGWTLETNLSQPVEPDTYTFGYSLSVSEDAGRLVVANRTDRIFLFEHGPDGWQHTRTFSTLSYNAQQVALSDDGQTFVTRGIPGPWAWEHQHPAEVWQETTDGWERSTLLPRDEVDSALVIAAVGIDGDRIVLGTPLDDRSRGIVEGPLGEVHAPCTMIVAPCKDGAVYLFDRDDGEWSQQAKLVPGDDEGPFLGWDVDVSGDTVVAGAPIDRGDYQIDPDPATKPVRQPEEAGSVYVFGPQKSSVGGLGVDG